MTGYDKKHGRGAVGILTAAAMLTAVSVVIGILCKNFFTFGVYYRVTFENLPVIIAGILFGPVVGGGVGVCADIVSCLCSANPAVNPLISVGALCVGVVSGIVPRTIKNRGNARYALTVASAHLIGQVAVKSVAKMIWFGMPWWGVFIGLGISALVGTVEYMVIKMLFSRGVFNGMERWYGHK